MAIEMKVLLPISRKGKEFVVERADALAILLGSSAVSGNQHLYGIKKNGHEWHVPVKVVEKRYAEIRDRIEKDLKRLKIMHSIMVQAGCKFNGKRKGDMD